MIHGIGVELIDPAIAPVAVRDVIPHRRAGEADRPIVLGARHQPLPRIRVAREVFELGDAETLVQRLDRLVVVADPVIAAHPAPERLLQPVVAPEQLAILGHEACHKILVLAARFASCMVEGYAHDLVTGPARSIPGTMESSE